MDIFHSITAVRLFFVLGIVNLVLGVLVFSTCRCIPMSSLVAGRLAKYPVYKRFYRLHCYLWPALWLSVIVHAVFAIGFLGNPF
jgi:hypothetical protein